MTTLHARLRDGTPVVVRPVGLDDKALLKEGFKRLSEASGIAVAPIR